LAHWLPALWIGQWTFTPSEQYLAKSLAGANATMVAGFGLMLLMACLFAPLLRRDRIARFFALGMILSLVPACSTYPMDRLLLFVGLGAAPLLALFVSAVFAARTDRTAGLAWRMSATVLAGFFLLVHLVFSPLWLPVRTATTKRELLPGLERMAGSLPHDSATPSQTFVLVQGDFTVGVYFSDVLALQGFQGPAHWRVLAPDGPLKFERRDDRSVVIRPVDGFHADPDTEHPRVNLARRLDNFLRAREYPLVLGTQVNLPGMSSEVTAVSPAGHPTEATFRFDVSLDDPSLRWFRLNKGEYVPFAPPAVGETVDVGVE